MRGSMIPYQKFVVVLVVFQILFGVYSWLSYPALRYRAPNTPGFTGEAHASQTLQSDLNP